MFQTFQLEINLRLTGKRGGTINDDDPTLSTTQKLVLLQSLRKKIENLVTNIGGIISHADPTPLTTQRLVLL